MKKVLAAAAAGIGLVAALGLAAPALADPASPSTRTVNGVGSDTTEDVLNGLSTVIPALGSYDATGSALINLPASGCTGLTRPNGSTAGRTALIASLNAASTTVPTNTPAQFGNVEGKTYPVGCLQFARSSSGPFSATASTGGFASNVPTGTTVTYVPFATDLLTYAFQQGGDVPGSLTLAQLQSIYKCDNIVVPTGVFAPLLPQLGSGTRNFWATTMGINATTPPSCVSDVSGGSPVQEHDGRALAAANQLVPFSVAKFISQQQGLITNVLGQARLGTIDGIAPLQANPSFAPNRLVYNVIPGNGTTGTPAGTASTFVGQSSAVCSNAATIARYGFSPLTATSGASACGDTSRVITKP